MNRRLITLVMSLAAGAAILSACGGDDSSAGSTVTSVAATVADAESGAEPAATTAATAMGAEPTLPDDTAASPTAPADPSSTASADACTALPSLEQVSATMGVTLTTATPLERGPGFDLCEVGGAADGVTNVQFTRLTDTTREQSIALAEQLGYPATDLTDPALPGGFTYAGTAAINLDGVEYTVQAIGLDTLGDPNSPVATERSAQLLVIWLANLGLAPLS
jgi:hypothetical protein